ncbi:MAG: TauD/TfdA family dioxygenase [Gammaproteobacteria bacterium]|nr:TauD/TfdA family dioxygenase [Gammaproteobacteria bacterium]
MNRETYQKSIFTDQRIIAAHSQPVKIDTEELVAEFNKLNLAPSHLSYIFHVAHCGSTLLARALDLASKNIVYREPFVLRQLSVLLAENNWGDSPPDLWNQALRLSTSLLSKSYLSNAPVIIKANVPVNFAIDNLMTFSGDAKGLLLYTTFDNYLLSILKSDNHRQWVSTITTLLGKKIDSQIGLSLNERQNLSIAQTAACLWLAQVSIFNAATQKYPDFKTLDSELFYSDPVPVLTAAFQLFGNEVSTEEIRSIAEGDLFSQHAKMPGQQYDNEQRLGEKKQLTQLISGELREAREWLLTKIEDTALPQYLLNPLINESPELVENLNANAFSGHHQKQEKPANPVINLKTEAPYLKIIRDKDDMCLDDIDDEIIINGFKQHGAILFRGFAYDVESFTAFVKRFCTHSVYNPSIGREVIDRNNNIQTVDLGDDAFPLHAELCREPWRPDVCFFACETAPKLGGETTICDGVKIVEALDEEVISQLQAQPLIYFQPMLAEDCKQWLNTETPTIEEINNPPDNCPFQLTRLEGDLTRSYNTPALHHTMFDKQLAFGNFLLFSRYGLNNRLQPCFLDGSIVPDELVAEVKRVSEPLTTAHQWEKDDLLMLDNTRFLHGRNKILNINERRIISYFGYLKFAELDAEQADMVWREPVS